ncbi:MAG: hypothetical protein GY826_22510, partial [Fuerstiella sp.]|nr:hypothetical protein [Fuerstiella sp.]
GQHTSRRKNGKIYEWNKYKCGTNLKHGHKDKYADGCYHCQVDDGQLTRFVADSLQRQLTPANLKRLEEALTRKASKPQRTPDVSSLKRKLSKLGTDIDKAADRLLRADDDLMDILSPRLREMREEMAAWRDGFLAAKEGEEQTAEKLRQKEKTWQRYFAQGERFPPFLGRMTDVLHVEGLTG